MPISKYFGGHGVQVMRQMKEKKGEVAGEREFYATANKQKKFKANNHQKHNLIQGYKNRPMKG